MQWEELETINKLWLNVLKMLNRSDVRVVYVISEALQQDPLLPWNTSDIPARSFTRHSQVLIPFLSKVKPWHPRVVSFSLTQTRRTTPLPTLSLPGLHVAAGSAGAAVDLRGRSQQQ